MIDDDDPIAFTFVPTRARHDGWTPERQRRFIAALAQLGVVARAARAVGKSVTAAHKLRDRPDAGEFAKAWDIALAMGRDRAYAVAVERGVSGYLEPRFYRGRQIGTVRRYDDRLLIAALATHGSPRRRGSQ